MSAPELLYHYTNHGSLVAIIESDSLWLTDVRYLNDSTEYVYAVDRAREVLTRLDSERDTALGLLSTAAHQAMDELRVAVYVSSLSEERDLLSQWRAYCPTGAGVAIGFHRADLEGLTKHHGGELRKARYESEQQKKLLVRQLDYAIRRMYGDLDPVGTRRVDVKRWNDFIFTEPAHMKISGAATQFARQVSQMATFFKHPSFAEEREWRVVIPKTAAFDVQYRPGKSYLTPHIVVPLNLATTHLIRRIVVGPSPHPTLAVEAVRRLAADRLNNGCAVETSEAPYRAW